MKADKQRILGKAFSPVERFNPKEIETFQRDPIWQAMTQSIEERIAMLRDELEECEEKDLKARQHECLTLRFLLTLPALHEEVTKQEVSNDG